MKQRNSTSAAELTETLKAAAPLYGISLPDEVRARLADYYTLLNLWNARLHLVAPCPLEEFARRHLLESLYALRYIPEEAELIDVGAGAGLPSLPCLAARPDLRGTLVEASPKKSVFLREAVRTLGLTNAASIVTGRFEELPSPKGRGAVLMCRALDRFSEMLPVLLDWAREIPLLLLYGGPTTGAQLESLSRAYEAARLPESEQRFIFVVREAGAVESSPATPG